MLDIKRPEADQFILVILTVDRTRPEWAVFDPQLMSVALGVTYMDSESAIEYHTATYTDCDFPRLWAKQPLNRIRATFNYHGGKRLLKHFGKVGDKPIIISGNRREVITSLVSIYPLLHCNIHRLMTDNFGNTIERLRSKICVAHDAMLEFVHQELSVTPTGVLDINGEVING